ncbi:MAG TPA: GvpL/GvpF family gas vesicle protein [Nocardioides sp.]|uniref:GvpL/GvpF family gas vesicle protein n=1 Tax=Nocardioides sp. TaxID=35761 RepID=UPI002F3FF12F
MSSADVRPGTGLFVYAVVRAERDLPEGLVGVDGNPVALVPYGEIGAVVGEIALDRPPGRRADLTAYSAVMEALVPGGAVAPIRFGYVLRDDHEVVAEVLAPREDELTDLLEQLEGRVQYNVRASYVEDTVLAEIVRGDPEIRRLRDRTRDLPEDAGVGDRIRLGELVSQTWERLARVDADHLLTVVAPVVAAHAVRREPGPSAALDAALLVETERSQELEDTLEMLAEQASGRMQLRLVGPLAPYDFVGTA